MKLCVVKKGIWKHSQDSKSIRSFCFPKDSYASLKTAAVELVLAYHMNKHTLFYCSLDSCMKMIKAIFPDSEVLNKLCCGKTKGVNIDNRWVEPSQCRADSARFHVSHNHMSHSDITHTRNGPSSSHVLVIAAGGGCWAEVERGIWGTNGDRKKMN